MRSIVLCVGVLFLQACEKGDVGDAEKEESLAVKMNGVIRDGYTKRFHYAFSDGHVDWALDVVEVPASMLEKEVVVEGRPVQMGGVSVLTNVMVDGQRLKTKKEWAIANDQPDPFAVGDEQ